MEIVEIKQLISTILDEHNVKLYDVKWLNQGKNRILQVAIMHEDGLMDLDTCQTVSEAISLRLDDSPLSDVNYFLEVCSPGAEREIREASELSHLVGKHIYVRFNKPEGKNEDVKGDLISYVDNMVTIEYQDKAVKKKITFNVDNIDNMNLAVKI